MSKTECKRCGGNGMPEHKAICGGVCFLCGALPSGEKASAAFVATARERMIGALHGLINRAKSEIAEGTAQEWWSEVRAPLRARLAVAPADVAARATAAFEKMGLAV